MAVAMTPQQPRGRARAHRRAPQRGAADPARLRLGSRQRRHRQDARADHARAAPDARRHAARAHPLPHLHQGRRRRDVEARVRHAGAVGDDAPMPTLARQLADLLGRAPATTRVARARTLFAIAIETPGGLKVQTIHAFCERLLQRFPLEAGVPPGFTILDEETAQRCSARRSTPRSRGDATASSPAQRRALQAVVRLRRRRPLRRAAARRADQARLARSATRIELGEHDDEFAGARGRLSRAPSACARTRRVDDIDTRHRRLSSATPQLVRLRDALDGGSANDAEERRSVSLPRLRRIARAQRASRRCEVSSAPAKRARASRLMTKAIADAACRSRCRCSAARRRASWRSPSERARPARHRRDASPCIASPAPCCSATRCAKARRAALDFDDLIAKTRLLLGGQRAAAWVLFKLDGGLDHILVDEAQDTSPEQWQIIEALAAEFFSGAGARERARARCSPSATRSSRSTASRAPTRSSSPPWAAPSPAWRSARRAHWQRIPLDLSFRTVAPVSPPSMPCSPIATARRASPAEAAIVRHGVHRMGHAGLVEIWPTEVTRRCPDRDAWTPLDEERVARAGRAAGRAHRRHHPALARQRRDAAVARTAPSAPATS